MSERGLSPGSIWYLRTSSIFKNQTTSLYDDLTIKTAERSFDRGEVVPTFDGASEIVQLIVSGNVKVAFGTRPNSAEPVIEILGPGDILGGMIPTAAPRPAASAEGESRGVAMSPTTTLQMTRGQFESILSSRPTVLLNFASTLAESYCRLEVRLSHLLFRSSAGKVACVLTGLGERYGRVEKGGVVLEIGITHKDIALMLGLRRESVSLAMSELEYRDLIKAKRGQIVLLDVEGLKALP